MRLTQEQINKVEEGRTYKNWKQFCNEIGIKYTSSSKGQAYQKLELKRYFDYEKEGRKIIINSKRDIPLREIPRGYNPYGNMIELLILDMLLQNRNDGYIYLSTSKLLLSLSMINRNYNYFRYNISELHKLTNINKLIILEWYSLTHRNLKNTLESNLNRLRKKALINWTYSTTIVMHNAHTKADQKEIENILEAEKYVLNMMNLEDIQQVVIRRKYKQFINKVNDILKKKYSIDYYYNSYEIVLNRNDMEIQKAIRDLKQTLNTNESIEKRYNINTIVMERLDNNINKRNKLNDEDIIIIDDSEIELTEQAILSDILTKEQKESIRKSDDYVSNNRELNNILINKDTKIIRDNSNNKNNKNK